MSQVILNQLVITLNDLSSNELRALLDDDDKLEEKVNEAFKTLESERDLMLNTNVTIAEESLNKEPQMVELKGRVNDVAEQIRVLCLSIQEKLETIKSKSGNAGPETTLALLQTAAAQSEEDSDKIVKQLLDKELPIDAFLEQFLSSRKTMHLRKIKSEKMTELLRKTNHNTSLNNSTGFYPYPSAGNVPYPTGAMHMPMPGHFNPY